MRLGIIAIALLAVLLIACDDKGNETLQEQRTSAVASRASAFNRAEQRYPVPVTNNFPIREALIEFTKRQDETSHPWYTYILGDNGNMIGYYVTKTGPINSCNFLSSTEEVKTYWEKFGIVLTAPSYDGIYYGGGGSQGSCDKWFFFDYATNAKIEIRGLNFFTTDAPLAVDAQPIRIRE